MKLFLSKVPLPVAILVLCLAAGAFFVGCSTTSQTTTYNALASLEAVADTGYSNYVAQVIAGKVPTNSLPQVSRAYDSLHAAIATASAIDQAGTNFLVQSNLSTEANAFILLLSTATKGN